jgi:hypothetical protein
VRIAGAEVAEAVTAGLIAHWRNSLPLLRSQRKPEDRNSVGHIDLMGIAGVSLEAEGNNSWADTLSSHEATAATGFATLELNGFPRWLSALTGSRPHEVREVIVAEIIDELSRPGLTHYDTLNKVAYADDRTAVLLAYPLLDYLETRVNLPSGSLSLVLRIILRGVRRESAGQFVRIAEQRFEAETDLDVAIQYLAAVFHFDAASAVKALSAKLRRIRLGERTTVLDRFVAAVFGGSISGIGIEPSSVPAEALEDLVRLTFRVKKRASKRK